MTASNPHPPQPPGLLRRVLRGAQRAALRMTGVARAEDLAASRAEIRQMREALRDMARATARVESAIEKQTKRLGANMNDQAALIATLGEKGLTGRIKHVGASVQSVIRRLYVDPAELPPPHALLAQRFGILSQNEEDGLVWAIFKQAGVTNRKFVEIGSGVNGGNSGFLAEDCGWTGLMVDASEDRIQRIRQRFGSRIASTATWVTRENVNTLIRDHGCGGDIDLLSIDIDGNDYWLWEHIDACNPRLVIVEYNASFGGERAVVVPYAEDFDRHRFPDPRYYGASLQAFTRLAARKGYRLVVTEPRGVNAFFLRNDVCPQLAATDPETMFRHSEPKRARESTIYTVVEANNLPLIDVPA